MQTGRKSTPPMQTLNVLVVTNMWPNEQTPMSGIFVEEQVAALRQRGVIMDVLFVDGGQYGLKAYVQGLGRVRRALRSTRYDVVHAHYVFSGLLAWGGAVLAGRAAWAPVVLTHHGIETQVGWTAPLCRLASRLAARTIVTSSRVRRALGRPDADIVPCGVDLALFQPLPKDVSRMELGLPQEAPLVLFAGMRRPEKRFDLIEVAFARVRETLPQAQLVIAEHESHERMPLFMNACDVLVLASEAEGSPMVIKEALACNLPIVSVDVGDVAELVASAAGCFLVERNCDALAQGLLDALAFGQRTVGRSAVERLSLSAVAEQLVAIYEQVATSGSVGGPPASSTTGSSI